MSNYYIWIPPPPPLPPININIDRTKPIKKGPNSFQLTMSDCLSSCDGYGLQFKGYIPVGTHSRTMLMPCSSMYSPILLAIC